MSWFKNQVFKFKNYIQAKLFMKHLKVYTKQMLVLNDITITTELVNIYECISSQYGVLNSVDFMQDYLINYLDIDTIIPYESTDKSNAENIARVSNLLKYFIHLIYLNDTGDKEEVNRILEKLEGVLQ